LLIGKQNFYFVAAPVSSPLDKTKTLSKFQSLKGKTMPISMVSKKITQEIKFSKKILH